MHTFLYYGALPVHVHCRYICTLQEMYCEIETVLLVLILQCCRQRGIRCVFDIGRWSIHGRYIVREASHAVWDMAYGHFLNDECVHHVTRGWLHRWNKAGTGRRRVATQAPGSPYLGLSGSPPHRSVFSEAEKKRSRPCAAGSWLQTPERSAASLQLQAR